MRYFCIIITKMKKLDVYQKNPVIFIEISVLVATEYFKTKIICGSLHFIFPRFLFDRLL